jgi:hypothetical protein
MRDLYIVLMGHMDLQYMGLDMVNTPLQTQGVSGGSEALSLRPTEQMRERKPMVA